MATVTKVVRGYDVEVTVGKCVKLDARSVSELLLPCEWEGAQFRFPGKQNMACNVKLTGRTFRHYMGALWVRCEVEFVGDGEPSTFAKGWVLT
jgi:5-enolpyruvylshikimate-3-phosphate synthase